MPKPMSRTLNDKMRICGTIFVGIWVPKKTDKSIPKIPTPIIPIIPTIPIIAEPLPPFVPVVLPPPLPTFGAPPTRAEKKKRTKPIITVSPSVGRIIFPEAPIPRKFAGGFLGFEIRPFTRGLTPIKKKRKKGKRRTRRRLF